MPTPARHPLYRPPLDYPVMAYDEILRNAAAGWPDKEAIRWQGQSLTFRELDSLANALASGLRGLGIRKGDRIALYLPNRPEWVLTLFAAARLGAVVTPLNPRLKEGEVEFQVNDAGAVALVVEEALAPVVGGIRDKLASVKHCVLVGEDRTGLGTTLAAVLSGQKPAPPPPFPLNWAEDLVILPYSSGTTGLPKGVMLSHKNLVCNHTQILASLRFTEADVSLIFLPMSHIYGTMLAGTAVLAGATQIIMDRFDLEESLRLVQAHRVTRYFAVPPILVAMANSPELLRRYDLSSIRFIMVAAAPLAPEVARRVEELSGCPILQAYGLTEASPATHMGPVEPGRQSLDNQGFPVHDTEQKIVDLETGTRDLAVGEVGEVAVRGPQVMKGYWRDPEATATALRDGWLLTGDIGRIEPDGSLVLVDRKKEMIKVQGFSVGPAELEAVLFLHPAVADCAVVGVPDPEAGQVPKAFVALRPGAAAGAEELMAFAAERVAGYKQVRRVEFVDAIPRTPSGKVLRRVLKERQDPASDS
jgi:long-chain acyl-CoA synthetase